MIKISKEHKSILNFFLKHGFYKFKLNRLEFNEISLILTKAIKKKTKLKNLNLKKFHYKTNDININKLRLELFNYINNKEDFIDKTYNSSKKYIDILVGNELCRSDINLSIQLPNDEKSLLEMHTDFFSGESKFQVNLWIPFSDVKKTQSMFIINPLTSLEILKKIKFNKYLNFNDIQKKYKSKMKWLKLSKGEGLLFSPNCLHGNVVNKEKNTRWSINVRYKNLFSPYNEIQNEKNITSFYKPYSMKGVTQFNLKYNFDEIN